MRLLWVENKSYSSYDTNYANEHSLPLAYASKAVKCRMCTNHYISFFKIPSSHFCFFPEMPMHTPVCVMDVCSCIQCVCIH